MHARRFDWMSLLGALFVATILLSLAAIGIKGWPWYKEILRGPAAGWVQAVGSIGAIIFGFVYTDRANDHQRAREAEDAASLQQRQLRAVLAASAEANEVVAWINIGSLFGQNDLDAIAFAALEAQAAFKSLNLVDLPDELLVEVITVLRKDLVSVLIHCRAIKAKATPDSSEWLPGFLPKLAKDLEAVKTRATGLLKQQQKENHG